MLATVATARDLDLLAARAFPAAEEALDHGWLLRASPRAAPRRVNSALPPCPADARRLSDVERWYAERGLVPRVMVSPEDEQRALDAELERRGWTREAPTDILVAEPADVLAALEPPDFAVEATPAGGLGPVGTGGTPRSPDAVVPLVAAGGAGRAVTVLQRGWSLVLALEVDPAHRRRGVASALVRAWAQLAGTRCLYLQVERENAPAHALYAAAGFARSHGYHYRRAPRRPLRRSA
jgi:N-acetylglutamate synthase